MVPSPSRSWGRRCRLRFCGPVNIVRLGQQRRSGRVVGHSHGLHLASVDARCSDDASAEASAARRCSQRTLPAPAVSGRANVRSEGGWGRTHPLRAGRPPSPVMGAAACPTHRLSSAFRAGSHPAMRAAFSVAVARFEAGRLVAPRGGFLRFASSAAGFGCCSLPAPQPHASAWARTRRLDRACTRSAPAALRQPAWGRVRLRVSTGAGRCCPPSCGSGSLPPIPRLPAEREGASRPLPSAVPGLQRPGTAHGERRSA